MINDTVISSGGIENDFDLIIVGGGLVGAGLAVALQKTGLKMALIDARLPGSDDPRLFALNDSSCQFLKNLGVWSKLSMHAAPIREVHVSHQGHFGAVRLQSEEVNLPSLGHVVPARYIEAALNEELETNSFTFYRPATLKALQQDQNQARLTILIEGQEKILYSRLVIGADGTESTVRKQLNIPADIFDYDQSAIVTRTLLHRSHHAQAYERFTANGAIAMLPLTGDECATIWTAKSDFISSLMDLSEPAFLQILQKEFGYRLGRLQQISQRHVFPLRMVRAQKMIDQCVFLLGNAAHTLHPVAAQGFNLALYEVAALAEGMKAKLIRQETFTTEDLLQISEKIQKQQAMSIGISHRLSQFFSQESLLLNFLSQIGMIFFDIATPIKKRFIKEAMGRTGRVPYLLLSTTES
jgi:2-octaprenyl-6-methoxyphenol hydroxylase